MNITNIFYYEVINEVILDESHHKDGIYNVYFNTCIPENNVLIQTESKKLIPTLFIKNKKEFDKALTKYIEVAAGVNINNHDYVKALLLLLWSNALPEDFENPVEFINRRTAFLCDNTFEDLDKGIISLGYSETLGSELEVTYNNETIEQETSKSILLTASNGEDIYEFPTVKIGIDGDTAYIYAIQKLKSKKEPTAFTKKINRALYKVGEGFDKEQDNEEIYGSGNLSDVSASFLVAANVVIGLLESKGIHSIVLPSMLLVRYNAKTEYYIKKNNYYNNGDSEKLEEFEQEHLRIQTNLTEKFLRTFLRLCHHHKGLEVIALPYENDSSMHIHNNGELQCNNSLLNETYNMAKSYSKERSL